MSACPTGVVQPCYQLMFFDFENSYKVHRRGSVIMATTGCLIESLDMVHEFKKAYEKKFRCSLTLRLKSTSAWNVGDLGNPYLSGCMTHLGILSVYDLPTDSSMFDTRPPSSWQF